jgi:hypothetical protein
VAARRSRCITHLVVAAEARHAAAQRVGGVHALAARRLHLEQLLDACVHRHVPGRLVHTHFAPTIWRLNRGTVSESA